MDEVDRLFAEAVSQGVFPGGVFGLAWGPPTARQTLIRAYGRLWASGLGPADEPPMSEEVVFDLASLTKPLATVLAVLCLKKEGLLSFTDPLPELLGRQVAADKRAITLAHLLQHCSGLAAHRPYFEALRLLPADQRRRAVCDLILAEPLLSPPGESVCYSDLGYLLLGQIVEERGGQALDALVKERLYAPLGLEERLVFSPRQSLSGQSGVRLAPTEDCPWRGKIMHGEVHDDNAFVLGGVAGHAGLFGAAGAVLELSRLLLDLTLGRGGHPQLRASDLRQVVSPSGPAGSSWGLGFDTPSPRQSSAGDLLSRRSFGHLGFTGTSFWCDPDRDLVVVLLTNRVHPCRDNPLIRQFRPRFHDAVVRCLSIEPLPASY